MIKKYIDLYQYYFEKSGIEIYICSVYKEVIPH